MEHILSSYYGSVAGSVIKGSGVAGMGGSVVTVTTGLAHALGTSSYFFTYLSNAGAGGAGELFVNNIVDSVSFDIRSRLGSNASNVQWFII